MFELNNMTDSVEYKNLICGPSEDDSDDWSDDEIMDGVADAYGVDSFDDCDPADGNW